jgi:hypothetical protein
MGLTRQEITEIYRSFININPAKLQGGRKKQEADAG